ncbi:MAG: hypothetical protein ACQUHE_13445 [Bacteroidia bacterium]
MRVILFFILLGLSLPGRSQSTPHKKAIELNNRAIKVRSESGDLSMKLKKSNLILDSAIKLDPKYLLTYSNKLNNLIALGEYQQAIEIRIGVEDQARLGNVDGQRGVITKNWEVARGKKSL